MSNFEVGSKVIVRKNDMHPDLEGQQGVIEDYGAAFNYWVKVPANERGIQYGFNATDLQLAPAQPATADAGADRVVSPSYIADHVANGDFASVWDIIEALQKQVAQEQFYAKVNAERGNDFEAECERLQAKLAAAEAREKMLLASLHNIRDMRVNPTGNDDYDTGRRMGYQITTELAQAAINAHAKALQASAHGKGE